MHELPSDVRIEVLREMARVAKPDGLIVIVDSIQRGDHPDWDGLLDLFPHYFHEPYYAEYVNSSLAISASEAGLVETGVERAFLSRITVLRPQ
jgi:ubiquinone/menaquinone biosynthesis C-methylase UbiE